MSETYRKVTRLLVPTRCQPGEQGPPRGGDLSAHHSHGTSDVPLHLLPQRGGRVERIYTLRGAMPRRFLQHRQGEGTQRGLHHGAPHAWPQWAVTSTFIIPGLANLLILRKKPLLSDRIIPWHREFTG